MTQPTILIVVGTRPEAIKMAPVIHRLRREPHLRTVVCATAQHRDMLDQVFANFEIKADIDLDLMRANQNLVGLTANVLTRTADVLADIKPACVLVHGDTTTAMAASLAAFYANVDVGHVEAGLRTGDLAQPWPEEFNRRVVDVVAKHYFAPTNRTQHNLLAEGVRGESILVTGNTVIDALLMTVAHTRRQGGIAAGLHARYPFLRHDGKLVLVTGHRRENHEHGLASLCRALKQIARETGVQVVYPVHPNPNVQRIASSVLGDVQNVHLISPLDYPEFVWLMQRSSIILTDSGGIQEEAPSLGKPVLVLRDVTERPEALEAGTVTLVGTDENRIVSECTRLLTDDAYYRDRSTRTNPFGDGRASERIVSFLREHYAPHQHTASLFAPELS
ncbi:non-hydrolyzing UDP-N-acetylglucosamine 2-epimerase [Caballeronia concitans]|uniref:UDP-N-acetylglucosamine 2-epimerase (non-hydrolyzing) n=1 Tax=Caballeronia concitans TaxID=1777133 RepID=A0A658R2B8_9BURK|nr:UDP-N-acetylglucosamine 2-epimerase (non-hydrolyzing) [Caballeronia concitans]KIG08631.1 UDP-N-acetylglucosamine 2-epimerase [Burkholderia sp. MR1]SAL40480.1 UDP-N-acetylglucosamine 2-epimerase [Caballeronia concitans]